MAGNSRIFISHAHADNDACTFLLAGLDAWGVDYWFDLQEMNAGQQLSARLQEALAERDIFVRVCTPNALTSFWMDRELAAFRGLREHDRRGQDARRIIYLMLPPGSTQPTEGEADLVVDAVRMNPADWLRRLREGLGVPAPRASISRRRLLTTGAAGAAVVVAGAAGGTLLLTSRAASHSPRTLPTGRLATLPTRESEERVQWFFRVGGTSAALTVGASRGSLFVGSQQGLFALNSSDGGLLWRKDIEGGLGSPPPVAAADSVYVLDGFVGTLSALRAEDGREQWHAFGVTGTSNPNDLFLGKALTLIGQVIYVAGGSKVYALSSEDGAILWGVTVPDGASVTSGLTVAGGILYFGANDGVVYALDASNGHQRWFFQTRGIVTSTPAAASGIVVFGGGEPDVNIYALDAATGALRWQVRTGSTLGVDSSPAIVAGVVYIGAGDGVLRALDLATGTKRWQKAPSGKSFPDPIFSDPVVANGVIYLPKDWIAPAGLYALSAKDGSHLWRYLTGGNFGLGGPRPVLANGTVYFAGGDHTLYALKI